MSNEKYELGVEKVVAPGDRLKEIKRLLEVAEENPLHWCYQDMLNLMYDELLVQRAWLETIETRLKGRKL